MEIGITIYGRFIEEVADEMPHQSDGAAGNREILLSSRHPYMPQRPTQASQNKYDIKDLFSPHRFRLRHPPDTHADFDLDIGAEPDLGSDSEVVPENCEHHRKTNECIPDSSGNTQTNSPVIFSARR
jgi:hypothetical protein